MFSVVRFRLVLVFLVAFATSSAFAWDFHGDIPLGYEGGDSPENEVPAPVTEAKPEAKSEEPPKDTRASLVEEHFFDALAQTEAFKKIAEMIDKYAARKEEKSEPLSQEEMDKEFDRIVKELKPEELNSLKDEGSGLESFRQALKDRLQKLKHDNYAEKDPVDFAKLNRFAAEIEALSRRINPELKSETPNTPSAYDAMFNKVKTSWNSLSELLNHPSVQPWTGNGGTEKAEPEETAPQEEETQTEGGRSLIVVSDSSNEEPTTTVVTPLVGPMSPGTVTNGATPTLKGTPPVTPNPTPQSTQPSSLTLSPSTTGHEGEDSILNSGPKAATAAPILPPSLNSTLGSLFGPQAAKPEDSNTQPQNKATQNSNPGLAQTPPQQTKPPVTPTPKAATAEMTKLSIPIPTYSAPYNPAPPVDSTTNNTSGDPGATPIPADPPLGFSPSYVVLASAPAAATTAGGTAATPPGATPQINIKTAVSAQDMPVNGNTLTKDFGTEKSGTIAEVSFSTNLGMAERIVTSNFIRPSTNFSAPAVLSGEPRISVVTPSQGTTLAGNAPAVGSATAATEGASEYSQPLIPVDISPKEISSTSYTKSSTVETFSPPGQLAASETYNAPLVLPAAQVASAPLLNVLPTPEATTSPLPSPKAELDIDDLTRFMKDVLLRKTKSASPPDRKNSSLPLAALNPAVSN